MQNLKLFFIGLLVSIMLVGCDKPVSPPLKIAIETTWVGYIDFIIAQELDLFAKHKVVVELVAATDGLDTSELYRTRQVDGLLQVFPDTIVLNSVGYPTQVVMLVAASSSADGIVAQTEFHELADLAGKTISFEELNSFSHLFVLKLMEKAGLAEGSFNAMTVVASEALAALEAGEVDAAYTYEPTLSQALEAGYQLLAQSSDLPGLITDVLAFRDDVITQRAADIKKLLAALFEAQLYVQANPEQSLQIFAAFNQDEIEAYRPGFEGLDFPDLGENYAGLQDDGLLFTMGAEIIAFYLAKGQIITKPNLNSVINSSFIRKLYDEN